MNDTQYDVFISYSRKDYIDEHKHVIPNNVVSLVKDTLRKEDISYWFDEDGIYSGQNFAEKIVNNIESSKVFLFLSTANSNNSEWTCKEIASADTFKKHIIPLRIDSTPYNKKVLFRIADLDYIEYYTNPQKGLVDMVKAIKIQLEKIRIEEEKARKDEEIRKAEERKKEEERLRRQREEEERRRKKQEQLIAKIKLSCESLNTREAQVEIDRSNLLLQADTIDDTDAREPLKEYIANSSPIRRICNTTIGDIEELKAEVEELHKTNAELSQKLAKKMGKKPKRTSIVHFVYGGVILILLLFIVWEKFPAQHRDEVQTDTTVKENGEKFARGNTALDDSINVVFNKLGSIHPNLQANLDGYNNSDPEVTYRLGKNFDRGDFLKGNRSTNIAGMLFHRAADYGYADAQKSLGNCFHDGNHGYALNYDSAIYWYKKAIDNGSQDAVFYLANAYSNGTYMGTEKRAYKTKEAVELYRRGAENGNAKCQIALGIYYYDNASNYKEAKCLLEKGLKEELSDEITLKSKGQFYLGQLYWTGKPEVEFNREKACKWFFKSAATGNGYPDAMYYVGICYEKGYGVPKRIDKAKEWYLKAAEGGHEQAKQKLQKL